MPKIRIKAHCGCGIDNRNLADWTCHWTYRKNYHKGAWRAIRHFFLTKIAVSLN